MIRANAPMFEAIRTLVSVGPVSHWGGSEHGRPSHRRCRKDIRITGTETHKSILRRVVAALAVSGMVVSLAGRASGATFEKAINPNYSYTEDVQQTSDGGYVVGATFSNTTYVALIAKLDSSGNLQWQKQYQSSVDGSQLYALKQTLDGGYVWAGELQNSNGSDCAIVLRLDSSGNIQWQQTYGVAAERNGHPPDDRRRIHSRRSYSYHKRDESGAVYDRRRLDRQAGLLREGTVAKSAELLAERHDKFCNSGGGRWLRAHWISHCKCFLSQSSILTAT